MAKSKNVLGLVFKCVALVFCLLTIITFFIPTIKVDTKDGASVSSAQIVFLSEERAEEKLTSAVKKGDTDKAAQYTILTTLKSEDKTSKAFNAVGWLHLLAAVVSVVALVLLLLSLFKGNISLLTKIALCVALLFMVCALISQASLYGTVLIKATAITKAVKVGDSYAYASGVILGLVSSALACIAAFLEKLFAKKGA